MVYYVGKDGSGESAMREILYRASIFLAHVHVLVWSDGSSLMSVVTNDLMKIKLYAKSSPRDHVHMWTFTSNYMDIAIF